MTAYADLPANEPATVTAGDLVEWRREDLTDYPASSWALTYRLINAAGKIDITATAVGDYFKVSEAKTTTAAWAPGAYQWQAYVTLSSERYMVDQGRMVVRPNFAGMSSYDGRTHARRTLEAIEAVIERRATLDQKAYTINGRSLERTPIPDLLALRSQYVNMVKAEEAAERIANGLGSRTSKLQVRL